MSPLETVPERAEVQSKQVLILIVLNPGMCPMHRIFTIFGELLIFFWIFLTTSAHYAFYGILLRRKPKFPKMSLIQITLRNHSHFPQVPCTLDPTPRSGEIHYQHEQECLLSLPMPATFSKTHPEEIRFRCGTYFSSLLKAASNATSDGTTSASRTICKASGAPCSRFMPLSSHSME